MYLKKIFATLLLPSLFLIHFSTAQANPVNTNILLLGYSNSVGDWESLPSDAIAEGQESYGTLSAPGSDVGIEGTLTYGLAEFCLSGTCDPKYQFTVVIANNNCVLNNDGIVDLLDVTATAEWNDGVLDCVVESTLNELPIIADYSSIAELATAGIVQWEYFAIGNDHYLAAANAGALSWNDFGNNNIFKFTNNTFENFQILANPNCTYWANGTGDGTYLKNHGFSWRHFLVGQQHLLAMANNYRFEADNSNKCIMTENYLVNSYIYKWEDTSFNPAPVSMQTDSALMFESFLVNGTTFLAIAGENQEGTGSFRIYNYSDLTKPITQPNLGALGTLLSLKSFYYNNQTYLVFSRGNYSTLIYQVDSSGVLNFVQEIVTNGFVKQAEVFTDVNNNIIMVFGYTNNNSSANVYRWQTSGFEGVQDLSQSLESVQGWSHIKFNGYDYLAAVTGTASAPKLYIWDGNRLETRFPYVFNNVQGNISAVKTFIINNKLYLALAREDGTTSPILLWNGPSE